MNLFRGRSIRICIAVALVALLCAGSSCWAVRPRHCLPQFSFLIAWLTVVIWLCSHTR